MQPPISTYKNCQDQVRRVYLKKALVKLKHKCPQEMIWNKLRQFNKDWFDKHPSWLESSVAKDADFCIFYLLKSGIKGRWRSFCVKGFQKLEKKQRKT